MENENKNIPNNTQNAKRHNSKRKHHKPKSYFVTPAETQGKKMPITEQKSKTISNDQVAQSSSATEQKNHAPNHNNRNRKNHQRHHEKVKHPQAPTTATTVDEKKSESLTNDFFVAASKSDRLERPAQKKLSKFSDTAEYEKYSDYEEFTYDELYGDETAQSNEVAVLPSELPSDTSTGSDTTEEPTVEVIGIKFKDTGKIYYFDPNGIKLKVGAHAIVKTARGLEFGDVALSNTFVKESETVPPLRTVVRIATDTDIKHHEENKQKEDEAFRICNEKIIAHNLDMKLIDAQYTFDNSKLLFYFTSSGRVDFRDLVKDLAAVFRTRIELRQVGIRDEAKMVGGFGPCGRALCCSLFLTDFGQVSIKMAKEQNLSLNSAKISGICGRLMCCLRYEYEAYEYEIKHTPPVDTVVRTVDGVGVVTEISPMSRSIKVRLNASPDVAPKSYKRNEVTILKKKQ